jgi:hypothetical protein
MISIAASKSIILGKRIIASPIDALYVNAFGRQVG